MRGSSFAFALTFLTRYEEAVDWHDFHFWRDSRILISHGGIYGYNAGPTFCRIPPAMHRFQFILCALAALSLPVLLSETACADNGSDNFRRNIVPFLKTHCADCHTGDESEAGVAFDRFSESADLQTQYELWEKVLRLIRDHQMPPADAEQPSPTEVDALTKHLQAELATFDCTADRKFGRVTLRRLNRAEYNNTIRDLTGLKIKPADDFPVDDVGEGFDNVGDVLTISPVLLEKYLTAAERVAMAVMTDEKSLRRVFPHKAESDAELVETARRNVREFAGRAFRRTISDEEENRLFGLMKYAWDQNVSVPQIQETVIAAILSNPHFLFHVENGEPTDEVGINRLTDYELAARLSYFLWSSTPDQRLLDLAAKEKLQDARTLASEARRMLRDKRASALVDNFAGQWLQLRDIPNLTPDRSTFPKFDDKLQVAMLKETQSFLRNMIQKDLSVLDLLTADYTFVNDRLAVHYGMKNVKGAHFRRVSLSGENSRRRGVLTHAGILMLTSNPGRTSPVKRGKWILENILAEPPPPPPPDVPELEDGGETLGTLREQLEQHRTNPACAVCHIKMDALGFAMENFDAIGGWRDKSGKFDIDASGELPGGKKFHGASEMLKILVDEKKVEFCRCLSGKLLTYALGRGLVPHDRCVINDSVTQLEQQKYRFSALVTSIVTSETFRFVETDAADK